MLKILRGAVDSLFEPCCPSRAVVCCFAIFFIPTVSFAEDALQESLQVKEEETQLAKWFAKRELVESPFEYALSVGYRKDNFDWSVANSSVNIASELIWKDMVIEQLRAAARLNLGYDWFIRGNYATGMVVSGTNRDSDYAGNNRTQEYSRSDNKTGGVVREISIGLGNRLRVFDQADGLGLYLSPLAGFSIHQQALTMYDGRQSVPFDSVLSGLNNSYEAQWKGAWVGMDALFKIGRNILLNTSAEYHRADYYAKANWNLRNDLAHPVSFEHVADGRGILLSSGISYRLTRNLLLNAMFEHQRWRTDKGYDTTFFSYGTTSHYTLNPVSLDSRSISLGAVYQF